jgi:exopolysaccharide biosynthesis polyprenyl glycosylphosphotransferase
MFDQVAPERPLGILVPVFALSQALAFAALEAFHDPRYRTGLTLTGRSILASLIAETLILATLVMADVRDYPRSISVIALPLNTLLTSLTLVLVQRTTRSPVRALLLGDDEDALRKIEEKLRRTPRFSHAWIATQLAPWFEGGAAPPASGMAVLSRMLTAEAVDHVILGFTRPTDALLSLLMLCPDASRKLFIIPSVHEVVLSGRTDGIVAQDVRILQLECPLDNWDYALCKRATDVLLSLILLAAFLPLFVLVGILIAVTSGRPVIYSQTRLGKHRRPFALYKFRTMCRDAEKSTGPILTWDNDPRVTRLGRFLRRTRLDELPQLWNVILGQMSLVGPRPERPQLIQKIEQSIAYYDLRHRVKPGVTGLAQIHATYDSGPIEKLRFDLAYVYNYSLLLDLSLLARTLVTCFSRIGR